MIKYDVEMTAVQRVDWHSPTYLYQPTYASLPVPTYQYDPYEQLFPQ